MEFFKKIFGIKPKKKSLTNPNDYAINLDMENVVYLHDKKSRPYINVLMRDLQKNLHDITKDIEKTVVSFEDKKKDLRRKKMGVVKPIPTMTLEEFQELSKRVDELDEMYINNPLEYAKYRLGEERVNKILKERNLNTKPFDNEY